MPVLATPTAAQTGSNCSDAPVLPGGRQPAPLPVTCLNQHIIVPRTPMEPTHGKPILTRTFAINIPGEQKATIEYVMRDVNGNPVDLSGCLCVPSDSSSQSLEAGFFGEAPSSSSSNSSSQGSVCACPYKLVFRLCEYLSGGSGKHYPVRLIDDGTAGKVAVDLSPDDTKYPGIYFGEFAMIECDLDLCDNPTGDSTVIFSNKIYVSIGRNLWNNRMSCHQAAGPPSITEIRMHLRDTDPSESFLLDNLAFSDEEIMLATYLPVQYWNEIPPPIEMHNTATFPYRYHWLMGIAGQLFLMAAEQQRRNNLTYAAGGVQVNDQNREPNYEAAAQRRLDEYKKFVRNKKYSINLGLAYGEVLSEYSHF